MGYFRWTPENIEKLRELKLAGKSNTAIAKHFNVTYSSISSALNKFCKSNETSNDGNKQMSNSIALRKQAEELLKAASEMEERENFNKHKHHLRNKLNEIINGYDHLGEKIDELKEMLK